MKRQRQRQRGVALLIALIIVALVTTISVSMIWQQWRVVEVEQGERSRAQSSWILSGALDWARLILREDARARGGANVDHLGEPWAMPLEEARLSTFLAADKENNADDSGPEAFLSGRITDLQSRYNLRNLTGKDEEGTAAERKRLEALCSSAGVSGTVAQRLAQALPRALATTAAAASPATSSSSDDADPLMPHRIADLAWFGIDAASIERLAPYVTLLPQSTQVNANTASREVLAAVLDIDLGTAERLVQTRQRNPFKTLEDVKAVVPSRNPSDQQIGVTSRYFEVRGRLRLERRIMEERSIVFRNNRDVAVISRERINLHEQSR